MLKLAACLTLIFALSLAAGCKTTAPAVEGSGFEMLSPSPDTRQFIIANDRPFAEAVASHNRTCAALEGCRQ